MRWHFSHHTVQPSLSCTESAIHMAAKQVLLDHCELVVPGVSFDISAETVSGHVLHERDVLSPNRRIRFERMVAEVPFDDLRPDVVGYRGERQLLVEMYFRHRVDAAKRKKLVTLGLPALEIDLSDIDPMGGFGAVTQRVIDSTTHKEWLVYPGSREHRAYLEHRLRDRVAVATEAHREELREQARAKAELARLQRTRQETETDVDNAFAKWTGAEQEAWLRHRLGLSRAVPAFLCRRAHPAGMLNVPELLWQASIFERFIYGRGEGTKVTARDIYPCLRRRFKLPLEDQPDHKFVTTFYLEYLVRAGFLGRARHDEMRGPYYVQHDDMSMPPWSPLETRYDGEPQLSAQARGIGELREWRTPWPRWRAVLDEAAALLTASPYRDLFWRELQALSAMSPPGTPHHWAAPLVERGVPLEDCFALLTALGLMRDGRR
jgi:hypothetical protein